MINRKLSEVLIRARTAPLSIVDHDLLQLLPPSPDLPRHYSSLIWTKFFIELSLRTNELRLTAIVMVDLMYGMIRHELDRALINAGLVLDQGILKRVNDWHQQGVHEMSNRCCYPLTVLHKIKTTQINHNSCIFGHLLILR